ncbi:MAG TPA: DUF6263 family protein [Planctomycetota bacterium]|nr:DUF6263 family protein [Planctomycetota bacterium]
MSPFTRLRLLSFLCLTTPLVCQSADEKAAENNLKIAAKKGSTVWLLLEEKQEQTMDMGGQQMEMGNTTTRTLQLEVKDVDDKGNLVVEVKIARIHGSMTMPMMGDIEFDSTKKTEGEEEDAGGMGGFSPGAMTKAMTALAGKSFVAKVDAFGKVASLEGVAELLKDANQGPGMRRGGGSESQFKQYVESAFGPLPQKPIAQGATWDRVDDEDAMGVTMQTKLQLTLAKIDADGFEITATGTVGLSPVQKPEEKAAGEADEREAAMREMMKNMKVKNGKISGTQRVSRQDGFVIESSNTTTMDVDMPGPMGGEMSMSVKTTLKCKRTTAEAAMPKPAPKADKEAPKEAPKEAGK